MVTFTYHIYSIGSNPTCTTTEKGNTVEGFHWGGQNAMLKNNGSFR